MSEDKKFVNGLIVKAPRDGAPDFVKGSISIKTDELIAFLNNEGSEWVNIDIKESKGGKWYCEVNTWKPEKSGSYEQKSAPVANNAPDFDDSLDIPF